MSSEERKDNDIAAKVEDMRATALIARVLRMFDTKGDKMNKSLNDAETT
jgi:hypothetical protein